MDRYFHDPEKMEVTKVDFLSQEYFELVNSHPELADAFALGDQVIAFADGVAYEVLASDAPAQVPAATTPVPSNPGKTPVVPTEEPTQEPPPDTPAIPSALCGVGLLPLLSL
jgi:hypothetical protein